MTDNLPPYPEGDVIAACVCGSWPGGKCLRCPVQGADNLLPPDGDGMWEAYCAGAGDQPGRDAIASRDHLNAIFEDMRPKAG